MTAKRNGSRAVAATLAGVALSAFAPPNPAGATDTVGSAGEIDTAPVIWMGQISDHSSGAVITGRADPVDPSADPTAADQFVNLGEAIGGQDGTYALRAAPGDWYQQLADQDGWVRLTLIAGTPGQVGLGLLHVRWVEDSSGGAGHWISKTSEAPDDSVSADTSSTAATLQAQLSDTQVETINMASIPDDAPGWSSLTNGQTRSVLSTGWTCYGNTTYIRSSNNWMSIGKYYNTSGATENVSYQTSNSTASGYGFKVGASTGDFAVGGNIAFETNYTNGALGGTSIGADGSNPWGAGQIQVTYKLYAVTNCYPVGTPPASYGGGTMYLAVPSRWTGGIKNARWNAESPITHSAYRQSIYPNSSIGRNNGKTSTTSMGGDINISGASFTAGLTTTSSSSNGTLVTRVWDNPSNDFKYIQGQSGLPQFSGTFVVRGWQ